ncbi:MAG: fumarylacetoacetate hydrolase, partial [Halomonas sp.]
MNPLSLTDSLPHDLDNALLVGRVWLEGANPGPALVTVHDGKVIDLTAFGPTMADLLERDDLIDVVRRGEGANLGSVESLVANSQISPPQAPYLLAPCDVQAVKACGVTFAVSLLERVIEEQAGGDPAKAVELRDDLQALIGTDLSKIKPGSDEAMSLKKALQARGGWSQYMEVGIGPDAEVFTKAQPLSSVGFGTT